MFASTSHKIKDKEDPKENQNTSGLRSEAMSRSPKKEFGFITLAKPT